ncbi:MAG TPA: 1-deoxy-D-xylulose-5-phosphate reductoisomerase [Acidimicrobiia bacterium]|jgi:1-deoxy-D-xylulose-5-phosphate reductoisomerase|nr:1-deoxy-D-xylulose-5-phosphate reductoisomerase [Acidimicrobiia bacterium]
MTRVAVLGSTGSVGTQALEVIRGRRDRYEVVALAAGRNVDLLAAQAAEFGVPPSRARSCADDPAALAALAADPDVDVVLNAVVGFAGLPATIGALEAGKRLALANKESLIAGGPVVRAARRRGGGEIVPVDSEHSALYQALRAGTRAEVRRLLLTASGGPFRGRTRSELEHVTVEDALKHPTWDMGAKITIDSSTLMNKGLEVIEAHELFDVDFDRIDVVVHPQSVVHGMVEFTDGAVVAQLSMPDMRLPIGLALGAPDRLDEPFGAVDWATLGSLTFEPPDVDAFPALALAYAAGRAGGGAPAALSAANEVAVAAFLDRRIPWLAIAEVLAAALEPAAGNVADVADVLAVDRAARARAEHVVERIEESHVAHGTRSPAA